MRFISKNNRKIKWFN